MSTINYDKYDRPQLLEMMKEIPIELKNRDKTMRQELRKRVQKMVEDAGYSVDEVMTPSKAKGPKKKAAPKYHDPKNNSSTWTGRGRKPLWVLAALDSGQALDDLLI